MPFAKHPAVEKTFGNGDMGTTAYINVGTRWLLPCSRFMAPLERGWLRTQAAAKQVRRLGAGTNTMSSELLAVDLKIYSSTATCIINTIHLRHF